MLYLCLALMCICRPLRLEALCPHSSHTNSFSPRCLKASCRRSSVRDRKHLEQVEHCKATGEREVRSCTCTGPFTAHTLSLCLLPWGPPGASCSSILSSEQPHKMRQPGKGEMQISGWSH